MKSGKIKILHVIPEMSIGGAQKVLSNLLPAIAATNEADVSLLIFKSTPNSPFEQKIKACQNVRLVDLDLKKPRSLSPTFRMMSEVREADMVHSHLFPALYQTALASLMSGTPAVFTEHSTTNRRRNIRGAKWIERAIYSAYSSIVAISPAVEASLREWVGESIGKRIATIHNGLDVADYAIERPHPSQIPMLFGRAGKPIVMAARFVAAKDHATLIEAAQYLEDPEAFIALAGSGETLQECQRLAYRLGVEGKVVFLGERDDIPRLLAAAEVGVVSSHWEGFGMSMLEMLASGLPIVATRLPATEELADRAYASGTSREHIRLVTAKNARDMAMAINALLRTTPERRAVDPYPIEKTAEEYLEVYARILGRI